MRGSCAECAIRSLTVSPRDELHVECRCFGIALSLAPGEQLLDRM
jgi:hypothetical protein